MFYDDKKESKDDKMMEFKSITLKEKALYEQYLKKEKELGCEFSFASLYLWGQQNFAVLCDHFFVYSKINDQSIYLFPMGSGEKKKALDVVIADAKAKGIPCRITGVYDSEKQILEELYPGMFRFDYDEALFDYIYDIDDLADLKGKKYHKKRNHIHRFLDCYPDYTVESLTQENLPRVRKMVEQWYQVKQTAVKSQDSQQEQQDTANQDSQQEQQDTANQDSRQEQQDTPNQDNLLKQQDTANQDYQLEQQAMERAFAHYQELNMEGLVLLNGDDVLAVSLGSLLSEDTVDIHFEKARVDIQGAYAMINREFARYIRNKYPKVRFLNREEDMGIEGLRKAKQSYYPHHLLKKCRACLLEERYED